MSISEQRMNSLHFLYNEIQTPKVVYIFSMLFRLGLPLFRLGLQGLPLWFVLQMIGGSAAQSTTLQLIDAALGVRHDPGRSHRWTVTSVK